MSSCVIIYEYVKLQAYAYVIDLPPDYGINYFSYRCG